MFNNFGDKYWFNDQNKLHREDGPAAEFADGTKHWYQHGKLHRVDGPAIECPDGTKWWYQHGNCHRDDGPAIEWANGSKKWWFDGREINTSSQEEFERIMKLKAFW